MKYKKRNVKEKEYENKFGIIPVDLNQRLLYMMEIYGIDEKMQNRILQKRDQMLQSLFYHDISYTLFEIPEGAPRSRYRLINRANINNAAISGGNFIHVYNLHAGDDFNYMRRMTNNQIVELNQLICTPINLEYVTFHETPKSWSVEDKFLAEIGIETPITKPDWDNIGKKYCDMTNHNLWLDDQFVQKGTVEKFYSILPRIEIRIRYLNMLYNKNQYNSVIGRKDYKEYNCNVDYFKLGGN